jgi:hypothetical protein
MRHHYLFDAPDGAVLSVCEHPDQDSVTVCIELNDQTVSIQLPEAEFMALANLRFNLRFRRPPLAEALAA